MKTRKILAAAMAGLCAVSTMGVSAFAADEPITTSGAKSYKISAGFQAPTIDVTVPEEVLGVINPYMIPVVIDGVTFEAEGVASPKYTITNNSTQVGINVKATYSAEGLDGIVATEDAAVKTDDANNKDKKKLAYVTLNSESPLDVTKTDTTETPAGADPTQYVMAATENATPAMLLRLDTKTAGNNEGDFWIGGAVIEEPAEKWTASDRLSINVVLDINPFNTGAGGPTADPIDTAMTSISFTSDGTAPTTDAFAAATTAYTLTGGSNGDELTFTASAATGYTVSYSSTNGNGATKTDGTLVLKVGTNTMVVTVTDDATPTKTKTYTYTLTLS